MNAYKLPLHSQIAFMQRRKARLKKRAARKRKKKCSKTSSKKIANSKPRTLHSIHADEPVSLSGNLVIVIGSNLNIFPVHGHRNRTRENFVLQSLASGAFAVLLFGIQRVRQPKPSDGAMEKRWSRLKRKLTII